MEWNHCGHLGTPINKILARFNLVAKEQTSAQSDPRFEKLKIDVQDGGCRSHLGFSIGSFSYFVSHKRPNAHHQVSIQLDYRRDVQNMNSQQFSNIYV